MASQLYLQCQGSTNHAAIYQLSNDISVSWPGPYFYVNDKKIFTVCDPPHLLKSPKNAHFKYNIHYVEDKIAKLCYIKKYFSVDEQNGFQGLRMIRQS